MSLLGPPLRLPTISTSIGLQHHLSTIDEVEDFEGRAYYCCESVVVNEGVARGKGGELG